MLGSIDGASKQTLTATDRLLREINRTVTAEDQSLETVAKDQQLFIGRRRSFHVKRLSINDLVDQLVLVKNLLLSIEQYPPTKSGVRTLVEGTEVIDSCIDETYLANLEHLLLCLQDQLLALLVEKFVEVAHRHLDDCQGDQRRHSEAWFFEFPDARHPLSTTWPWSIRPSLAVIWGVCWMFAESCGLSHFDELGNAVDCQGTIVIPREVLQHCQSLGQQQLHPHQSSMAQGGECLYDEVANIYLKGQLTNCYCSGEPAHGTSATATADRGPRASAWLSRVHTTQLLPQRPTISSPASAT